MINSMESIPTNDNESQWIKQETEKIHVEILSELNRFENELNERFHLLKETLNLKQQKTPITNSSMRDVNELRVFTPRNSLLTDLFEISHIQGVRNVFAAILIIFVIQESVYDIIEDGRINLDFDIMFQSFANVHVALFIWLLMKLSTAILVFTGFYLWSKNRENYSKNIKCYDRTCLLIYITYIIVFMALPCREVRKYDLGIASRLIIMLEQLRQIMKVHAFVRENTRKVHSLVGSKSAEKKFVCPNFSQYLYFLFAPTLIYRDQYPRNSTIRWNFVVRMFGQVLATMFYAYYVVVRYCVPIYGNLTQEEITLPIFVTVLFNSVLPGSLFLLLAFYGFLHCWLNAFAEMLRFADRMFYKDWWNSTSFAVYYRTWNVVVQDWLYAYVYRDVYILTGRKHRTFASVCVILLSAVFHEYVMFFTLGFFFPVMFILFGIVGLIFLLFLPRRIGIAYNIIVWVFLLVGMGVQSTFYFMESYARSACPRNNSLWDDFMPRSFACRIGLPSSKA